MIPKPRHAQYSLGDFSASVSAFERGLKLEPGNANLKAGLENAKAREAAESASSSSSPSGDPSSREAGATTPSGPAAGLGGLAGGLPGGLGGLADLLGNMQGSGGGMPDIASLMQNPEIMRLASQFAASGGLADLMRDPTMANMVRGAPFSLQSQLDCELFLTLMRL